MSQLTSLLGIEVPIIQAPMAGSQGSALAIAVCHAGGLGSQPCAMLSPDGIRQELRAITAATSQPYNVNFFVHQQPAPDAAREAAWREFSHRTLPSTALIPIRLPKGRPGSHSMLTRLMFSNRSSRPSSAFILACHRQN